MQSIHSLTIVTWSVLRSVRSLVKFYLYLCLGQYMQHILTSHLSLQNKLISEETPRQFRLDQQTGPRV